MIRTWQLELTAVAAILVAVALGAGGGPIELIGAGAVMLSFAHAQVADRLAEAERERRAYVTFSDGDDDVNAVACHRWATRYLVGKEALWLAYFVAHRSWAALAGVGLFLAYPLWRRWWRERRPLTRSAP
jgi:hypothetical protein